MSKIKVLIKRVGEPCEVAEIENTLEAKQKIVGGLIEVVSYEDLLIICNEEGKILGLKPNVVFDLDYIAGDFIVAGNDFENGDFKSLTEEEIEKHKKDLNNRAFLYMS